MVEEDGRAEKVVLVEEICGKVSLINGRWKYKRHQIREKSIHQRRLSQQGIIPCVWVGLNQRVEFDKKEEIYKDVFFFSLILRVNTSIFIGINVYTPCGYMLQCFQIYLISMT